MSSNIGVAVVGCAHRPHAWSYAQALSRSSTAHLVGVFDEDPGLGHSVADDAGAAYTDDLAGLLGSDEVSAVVVCSPTSQHRAHVEAAARAGLAVLCEKPVATTTEDAVAMIEATRAAGVELQVAFVSRFVPAVQSVKAAVDRGALGEVLGLRAGNRGRPPLPPGYPDWITDPSHSGGGALIDHSVHLTDLVRHLTGQEVRAVAAETGSLLWSSGVEDCALLSVRLGDGAVGSLDPSWSVPSDNPWDYDFVLRLVGSAGAADLNDVAESVHLVSTREGAGRGLRLVGFAEDPDQAMIEAFVASVAAGRRQEPCASGLDGLRALEVALAGYASAADGGRFVAIDPAHPA